MHVYQEKEFSNQWSYKYGDMLYFFRNSVKVRKGNAPNRSFPLLYQNPTSCPCTIFSTTFVAEIQLTAFVIKLIHIYESDCTVHYILKYVGGNNECKRWPHDITFNATMQELWRGWGGSKETMKERERDEKQKMQETEWVKERTRTWRKMIKAGTQRRRGWRARTGVKSVTHSCPHHQRPVLIYPEQSIRSGGRHW